MANLCITSACNRRCSYCFIAGKHRAGVSSMSFPVFEKALDFLIRSGIEQARLLGGEPTLHPEFVHLAEAALKRGLRLLIFSNGLVPERVLSWLEKAPPASVMMLVNASVPGNRRQMETLRRLGNRTILGFNIHTPDFQPDFLLELIDRYNLHPSIRFGLAHPCPDGSNESLHPKQYAHVGNRLMAFAASARDSGVQLQFDCGFVPCMFPPGMLDFLGQAADDIGPRCSPVLDVLPDGRCISCFPLSELHQEMLPELETAVDLRRRFQVKLAGRRRIGIFSECAACEQRASGRCSGGCLAAAMRRFQPANSASTAVDESSEAGWILPYVDQPIVFWERLHSEIGTHIREIYFPLPGGVIGSGRPPQPDSQLQAFLKDSSLPRSVLLNPVILERPVDDMAPAIIEALRRLIGEFGIRSATVSSLLLAARIRESLPDLPLTASILMDIAYPNQILMLKGLCETVVPSGRIFRDLRALKALRTAFSGRIRLIVNEACLPACPYRIQHFYEMNAFSGPSRSLCTELLEKMPWMRLTGTWVLPQHLHLFEGLCDEWKLAGRVTLRDAANYLRVARAYIYRLPLAPSEIGGGPASVLEPIDITEDFFKSTLSCGRNCHECRICREYDAVMRDEPAAAWRNPEKGVENARRESLVVI